MNYLKQINAFWDFRRLNPLTSKQADLYLALLDCANELLWKPEFNAPNSAIMSLCSMSESDLSRCRNVLVQKGLIEYKKGCKSEAGRYMLLPLYAEGGNYGGNNARNYAGDKGGNFASVSEGKSSYIHKNKTETKQNLFTTKKKTGGKHNFTEREDIDFDRIKMLEAERLAAEIE